MSNLTRWDPFREMMSLRSAMDRMFDNTILGAPADWTPNAWSLALDVNENADEYLVKASVPGLNPDDLEVTFNNGVLTIKGEIKEEQETKETRWHVRERRWGSFSRSIQLPSTINGDDIKASYDSGVLTLHLPKVEEAKPRKIAVSRSEKMLEGKATDIKTKN